MPYVTNVVVEKHGLWSLTKHAAKSVNDHAGKLDKVVYGTKTNVVVTKTPDPPTKLETAVSVMGGICLASVVILVFYAYVTGEIKGRDIIGL